MTPFMRSVLETARQLTEHTRDEAMQERDGGQDWTQLEKRFACVICQSRALELRHVSTNLLIKSASDEAVRIAKDLSERSHILEGLAMKLATGPWPPDAETTAPVDIKTEIIVQ